MFDSIMTCVYDLIMAVNGCLLCSLEVTAKVADIQQTTQIQGKMR